MSETPDLHILAAVVENKFGVLARIAGLFSRRGFNIFSLAVAPTDDPELSRITIVVDVHDTDVDQIAKQLNKLINVLEINELQPAHSIERELMLARVAGADRVGVEEVLGRRGGRIVDEGDNQFIVSVHAHPTELDRCESELRQFGIHELQRTGRIALGRLSG
ncbi:MAG: acetolactate synthase small subunit [Actinomycetota bacterium]|nr:acetolactate synthase small subunit [Actinomycetota bacterium]